MHDKRNILKSLLPIVQTDNLIRKLGILKTARNCCYDRHRHDFLVSPSLGLIEALVLPLTGPEPVPFEDCARMLPGVRARMLPTAARDTSVDVRRLCVEIVHLLVVNRPEREYLRGIQVYTTLRELHKVETDETLIASIEEAVQYFLMDEAGDPNGANAAILAQGNAALAAAEAGNAGAAASSNPELAAAAAAAVSSKAALATVAEDDDDEVPRLVPSNRPPAITSANAPPRADVRRLESLPQGDGVEVDEGVAAAAIAELLDFP